MKKLFNFFKPTRLRDLIWNCLVIFISTGIMCVAVIGWFGAGSWQDTTYTYSILYPAVLVYVFMLGYYLYNVISKFVKKR